MSPTSLSSGFSFLRYLRTHPFSTMALCNIMGDLGFLGFAFATQGFVSVPKLLGASCTMLAHTLLLAYGDDQARLIADEKGIMSQSVLRLRAKAQYMMAFMPEMLREKCTAKPVGIAFTILSLNGVALVFDACLRISGQRGAALSLQLVLGILITSGTGLFAVADFARTQRVANALTKIAPSVLLCATISSGCFGVENVQSVPMSIFPCLRSLEFYWLFRASG